MTNALSLHVGLNAVDSAHYQGGSGFLLGCEFDAGDMAALAASCGFKASQLLTKDATRAAVIKGIAAAAKSLLSGDIFFLTYSGHGGVLPDLNSDESDAQDETWCLYDGQLVDDELYMQLAAFKAGVRILVLSDSCHSGTVLKNLLLAASTRSPSNKTTYRALPDEVALGTYLANKATYDQILNNPDLAKAMDNVKASAILISGCQDNQLSADGIYNGLFTAMLKRVWNGGKFKGTYPDFHEAIGSKMPADQTPNLFKVGAPNPDFETQTPFQV
jgi:metacaspase-1